MRGSIQELKDINKIYITNGRLLNFGMEILSDQEKDFLANVRPSKLLEVLPQGLKLWEIEALCEADDLTDREKAKLVIELNRYGRVSQQELKIAYATIWGDL